MNLIMVGTNHRYSSIELRERLSFSKKSIKNALLFLKERKVLSGAVILSTCNRVEVYASAEDPNIGIREIVSFISRYHEIAVQKFSPSIYIYKGKDAIRHLCYVACGLDSLVLGETQILGQVRSSLIEAELAGFANVPLKYIFYSAISAAKRAQGQTRISEGKASVASVAIDFIKERIGSLSGKNILIVGVGKVTELVLRYLKDEKPNAVFISNRTFDKAKTMAAQIGAKAVRFDDFKKILREADVVITATASPHFVIRRDTFEGPLTHKLLIVDLALPRDVDPRVREIEGVDLFSMEELGAVIKKNIDKKIPEAEKAREIVDIEVARIWNETIKSEREPAPLH